MNATTKVDVTGFTLVHVEINIPTGTARVERLTDLPANIAGGLPPKELLKDGRKAVLDAAVLQPLYNHRKQVHRILLENGTAFFGGTLVPNEVVGTLASRITAIETEFNEARDLIGPELTRHYAEWEAKHPTWASLFRQNRMTEEEFTSSCRFRIAMLAVVEPESNEASTLFGKATEAVIPGFLEETARAATKAYETHAKGRGKITQYGLAAVQALIGRLSAFSLLDPRIAPSGAGYAAILAAMPKTGPLNPRETAQLQGVLHQLMDPSRILAHGQASFDSKYATDELESDSETVVVTNEVEAATAKANDSSDRPAKESRNETTAKAATVCGTQAPEDDTSVTPSVVKHTPTAPPLVKSTWGSVSF